MFLYLKAIVDTDNQGFRKRLGVSDGGEIIPAGVIYVKTDMSDVTVSHDDVSHEKEEIEKNQKRRGMILDDTTSVGAMNMKYIPVKYTKSGSPDARYQKYLYTREGWNELSEKVSDKVREVADRMKKGEISLAENKKDSPCDYCKFKPICRKSN